MAAPYSAGHSGQSRTIAYYHFLSAARSRFAKEPAAPMFSRLAIQFKVILVSCRKGWCSVFALACHRGCCDRGTGRGPGANNEETDVRCHEVLRQSKVQMAVFGKGSRNILGPIWQLVSVEEGGFGVWCQLP